MRALAVLLVIVYHFVPSALPGGFIGVDVFFVLSGFLITSLLVQEWRQFNAISLKEFWRRRARRILPALALVLLTIVSVGGFIGGDVLTDLASQVFGALTFSSNWVYIATGASYEAALTPAIFNNLWSLAVEEQFYVVWPILVVVLFLATRRLSQRRSRAVIVGFTVLIAAASALLMLAFYTSDHDPSRVYFGTDTHLFGLMMGAVLAFVMVPHPVHGWPKRFPLLSHGTQWLGARAVSSLQLLFGALCLAVILWAAFAVQFNSPVTFRGGLIAVDCAAAGLIATIVCRQNVMRRLERGPLAWVGRRSYGLYLWHWPIVVLVAHLMSERSAGHDVGLIASCVAVALTLACAGLSYRFLERPVMSRGIRSFVRSVAQRINGAVRVATAPRELLSDDPASFDATRMRAGGVIVMTALVVTAAVGGTTAAFTRAPAENSIEASINSGADLIAQSQVDLDDETDADAASGSPLADSDSHSSGDGHSGDGESSNGTVSGAEKPRESSESNESKEASPVKAPNGKQITIIGDSVTLAAAEPLLSTFKGVYIDAEVSRPLSDAPKILKKLKKKDKLRQYVVLSLATNSTARQADVDKILDIVGDRTVIFVTGHADRSWVKPTNKLLAKNAKKHDNVFIADWNDAIKKHDDELASDGIHPDTRGAKRYAKVVKKALHDSVK